MQVSLKEQQQFWNAKRCKQLKDVKEDIKRNPSTASFSIDDTFDLASRVRVNLNGKRSKVYNQVQSIMYRGKTLCSLLLTASGAEHERKDISE